MSRRCGLVQGASGLGGKQEPDTVRFVGLLLLWLTLAGPLAAQAVAGGAAPPPSPEVVIAQARSDLHDAASGLTTRVLSDAEIDARLARVGPIESRLTALIGVLGPRLQDLQARQSQLGAPPAAGLPAEAPIAVQARRELAQKVSVVSGDLQDARLLALTAGQLGTTLSARLRENFGARLWARSRSSLDPGLWTDFAYALPDDLGRLMREVGEETTQTAPLARIAQSLAAGVAALLAGVFLLGPGRVMLNRLGYRRAARAGGGARLRRTVLALWLIAVAIATPLLAGLLLRFVLARLDAMTPAVDQITALGLQAGVFAAFLAGLGRALLSPRRPEWRLAPLSEEVVRRLAPFPGLIGAAAALAAFVTGLNTVLGASLATRMAAECLTVVLQVAILAGGLAAIGQARVARRARGAEAPGAADGESQLPWILATLAAWAAIAAAVIALLAGYLSLAGFLMRETVWIGAILGLLFVLLRLADDLFPALLSPRAPLGGALESALGLSSAVMEQTGVLLSGLARLLLILIAWVALLAPFGASAEDILHRFTATDFVVRLGLVAISPGAILSGIALFLAGLAITRGVRRWLEVRYLPKTDLDVGLRTSLAAGVTYLGGLIAILATFAYLGLSVAQIALFASALSVGIGFGLQSIIGNFVSGLILLAERPVRVGDWIAIGDQEGDVRKISIRATEIEMADHSRLIVPNTELVSKTVRNVTHLAALGRVKIVLKVDAAADADKVRDLLLARLTAHPKVLKTPAPAVYLTDVKDAALEFTAFAFLASPRLAYGVKSELLFQIVPDLKAAGIALASAATVVHLDLPGAVDPAKPIEPAT